MITNINGEKLIRSPSSSYKSLLDRVTFGIMDIAWRVGCKIVEFNTTSAGVGRRNRLFLCIYSRYCIIVIVISSIIVYIVVVMISQNCQVIVTSLGCC